MKKILFLSTIIMCQFSLLAKSGSEIISENGFKDSVSPLLETEWSQDGGENILLPMVAENQLAKTGCGATAMAQVMKYWEYPIHGTGHNYYLWESTNYGNIILSTDFESHNYDWENMISLYKNNSSTTDEQKNAVGTLMADLGIALEMKYETDGTATNIEYISTVLKKYYGYNPNMTILRFCNGAYTTEEWLTIIYNELSNGRPIIMGGAYNGANHLFVADGYNANGEVHLNLGKANIGSACNINGYFDLTKTGETYTEDLRMIIGISPFTTDTETTTANVATAGTLKDVLGGELSSRKICRLKITGQLNSTDIAWLKELTSVTTGQLTYLDLSQCSIEGNLIPSEAFNESYTLQEILLPLSVTRIGQKAFRECKGLYRVEFPSALTTIENYAFSNCRYLESISLPNTITSIGTNPFRYCKVTTFEIAPNSKFKIENDALLNAAGTTLYSMPVRRIGNYTITAGVETINSQAFMKQCALTSLNLPATVSTIKSNAFFQCYSIEHIYCQSTTPSTIDTSSFESSVREKCVVHVPKGYKEIYESSTWNVFANIVDDLSLSGVADTEIGNPKTIKAIYNLNGERIDNPIHGQIYIIINTDGTTSKQIF